MRIEESGFLSSHVSAKIALNRPKASTSAEKRRNPANAKLAEGKKIERQRAEEALRESEEKFRNIFEKAVDGILITNVKDKKFVDGNKAISQMLGYSLEEIKNLGVMDIHPEEDLPHVIEQFEKQIKGETTLAEDIPVKRKDGTVFYADINSIPITLVGKRCLMGIFRDITERKRAEEALKQKSEQQQALLSSIPAFVYLKDVESKYIVVNRAFAEKVNVPINRLVGKTAYDIFPKEQAEHFHADDKRVMSSGKPVMNIEEEFTAAEGKTRWASTSKIPYFDEKGKIVGMVGISWDITERKRAEEAVFKANKRRIEELEKLMDVAVGRELEMIELRERIRALELKLREITEKG